MFAAIMMIIIIWIVMWGFYKFMYPRAPRSMMPKDGDVTTPRHCNFCGNSLAEYRGVLETKPSLVASSDGNTGADIKASQELFFCNYEHQADFHAGRTYNPNA